jgi:hypothetical protein
MFTTIQGNAQFKQGDNLLSVGFGFNSYYTGGNPFCAVYEYGINDLVSLGGSLDYVSYHYRLGGTDYGFTAAYLGFKASYHFNEVFDINDKKWDIYGGGTLGYRSFGWSNNPNYTNGYYNSALFLAIHAGARYYFAPKAGVFLELAAGGATNGRLGMTFKF